MNISKSHLSSLISLLTVALGTLELSAQLYPVVHPVFEKHTIVTAYPCFLPTTTNVLTTANATHPVAFSCPQYADFAGLVSLQFPANLPPANQSGNLDAPADFSIGVDGTWTFTNKLTIPPTAYLTTEARFPSSACPSSKNTNGPPLPLGKHPVSATITCGRTNLSYVGLDGIDYIFQIRSEANVELPGVVSGARAQVTSRYRAPGGPWLYVNTNQVYEFVAGPPKMSTTTITQLTVNVANFGTSDLSFTAIPGASWLKLDATSGTLTKATAPQNSTNFYARVDATGLAPGTYTTTIEIGSNAPNGSRSLPVTLKVLTDSVTILSVSPSTVAQGEKVRFEVKLDTLIETGPVGYLYMYLFDQNTNRLWYTLDSFYAKDGRIQTNLFIPAARDQPATIYENITNMFLYVVINDPFAGRTMASNLFHISVEGKKARLIGLEVNQVIQDWRNTVPLISNKTTLVRAHLQSLTTNGVEVRGVLHGFRNGVELPDSPKRPTNPGGLLRAQVNAEAIRGSVASSLTFFLPRAWCTGTVNLQFESTNVECREVTGSPNDCSALVTFKAAPEPQVAFLRVKWFEEDVLGGDETTPVPTTQDRAQELANRLQAIYPIDRLNWNAPELAWTNTGPPTLEALLPWVEYIRILNQEAYGPKRLWYGILNGDRGGGLGYLSGKSSAGWMPAAGERYGRNRHAHELAHNLGLDHASQTLLGTNALGERLGYCGEVAGGHNPDFPFFQLLNGHIAATLGPLSSGDDMKIYGYDAYENKIIDPLRASELLSYCQLPDGRWVSSFTYSNILARIDARFGSGPAANALGVKEPETYLLVRGTIDLATDQVTFAPFVKLTTRNAPEVPAGPYIVRASATSGDVVSDIGFAPSEMDPDSPQNPTRLASFIIALKDDPDVKSISIVRDNRVIGTEAATPNAPQVRVITPNGGENIVGDPVTIRWTGSDADGDSLVYIVQYSPDNGATWIALAVDWPQQEYQADFASLPASGQGLIRVIAGDGFNTGTDQSDATFTVANHPPRIQIAQPENQQIALGDQELVFQASAHDVEDGDLPDSDLQWQSSLDGILGAGPTFSRNASSLSEGVHVITATARDSANATGSAVIHITVSRTVPAAFADLVLSQTKATGSESDLTITIENHGPSVATALQVTNRLQGGAEVFTVTSPSGECTVRNGTIVCTIDQLAVGASATINVQLELPAPGTYTNVASVAATEIDPSPANNVALRLIEFVPAMPQLRIELVGNTLTISWPATTPANTVLRSSPTLFPGDWTDVTEPATVVDGRFKVTREITTKTRFYRLERR
jgi:hypothetical protein